MSKHDVVAKSKPSKKLWLISPGAARWTATVVWAGAASAALVGCGQKKAGPLESGNGIEAIGSVSQRIEAQVAITGSTAGSSQPGNDHANSWDTDVNATRWSIDSVPPGGSGNPPDGSASWIDVNFARTNVTKVKMKLFKGSGVAGDATPARNYTLKIEVDGVQAWAGTLTPAQADASGYHTVSFAAKNGDDVKISMTAMNGAGTWWFSAWDIQVYGDNSAVCSDSTQCDDGNLCTQDDCTAGQCSHAAITRACDDGNSCTIGDVCAAGACVAGSSNCAGYVDPTNPEMKRSSTELTTWKFTTVTPSGQTGNTLSGSYDDSSWSTVTIPHVWDKPYTVAASKASNANPLQYPDAWYRTSFNLTEGDDITSGTLNKRIYLHFDGISTVADVYVNGVFTEQHKGAYTGFEIDANVAALHAGTNYVAVKVSNASCSTCLPNGLPRLWRNYGGMYRKAYLHKTNFVRVDTRMYGSTGTFITAANVTPDAGVNCNSPTTMTGSAQLRVVTSLKDSNPLTTPPKTYDVKHSLVDQDDGNKILSTFKTPQPVGALSSVTVVSQTIAGLKLWHVGRPKLYTLKTELVDPVTSKTVDFLEHKIGIRKFNLGSPDGSGNASFTLNNCNVPLRGVSKHQENENSGIAMTDQDFQKDWDGLEDLGVNYVRLPHYPHAEKEYELADQKGILVWKENGHTNGASNYFNTAAGEQTQYDNLNKEMVYQGFNHPSIVFWSTGNEVKKDSGEADDGPAMAKATEFGKVMRTADRVAQGVDSSPTSTAPTSRPIVYAFGDSNFGSGPSVDRVAYNIYPGWYVAGMNNFVSDAQNKHYISENGSGAQPTQQIDDGLTTNENIKVVDTYEPEAYGSNVNEIKHQTIFGTSGTKIPMFSNWVFRDFSDKKYGGRWNTKGIVSFNGLRKDTYYHFKSFLKSSTYMPYRTTTPVMHINGCHYFKRGSGTGSADIKVYSNASTVWLRVNGGGQVSASNGSYTYNGNNIKNVFYFSNVLANGKNVVQVCDSTGCSGTPEGNTHQCTIYRNPTSSVDSADTSVVTGLTSSQNNAYFFAIQPKDGWPVFHGFGADRTCTLSIDGANVAGQPCDNNTYDVIPSILTNLKGVISTRSQGGNQTPSTANTSLSFNVTAASTVYVMFTGSTAPAWITNAGFTDSGVTANWHGNSTTRYAASIYKKDLNAGNNVSFSGMTAMDAAILVGPSTGTPPPDTTAPTVPVGLAKTSATTSSITLSWTASTDDNAVTGYKVYRNGSLVGSPTSTGFNDTGLTASTNYSYTVSANDAAGNNSSQSSALNAATTAVPDSTAPSQPTGLAAGTVTSSSIQLNWTASTDNVAVTGYKVYRGGTQIGTSTSTSYIDNGRSANTSYSYTVSANDAAGNNSAQSSALSVTTAAPPPDTTAPSAPTGLANGTVTSSSIPLSWTASTDNVAVTGYKVFRGGTQVGTSTSTSYTDTGLTASTSYSYTVSAYDAAGNNSAQSAADSATTAAPPDTTAPSVPAGLVSSNVTSSAVTVSWTASTDNVAVTGYKIYRGGTQVGTSASTSFTNTGLTASTAYSYTVSSYDAAGNNSSQSSPLSVTTAGSSCSATIAAYSLGKCNATVIYSGKLYKCISQASGVNGSTQCGTAGVYCSTIAPDNAAWGTTAWQFLQNCP